MIYDTYTQQVHVFLSMGNVKSLLGVPQFGEEIGKSIRTYHQKKEPMACTVGIDADLTTMDRGMKHIGREEIIPIEQKCVYCCESQEQCLVSANFERECSVFRKKGERQP